MVDEERYDKIGVGKKLLEAFTSELYDNVEYVMREYISNAIDAKAQKIDIIIDKDSKDVMILDDGIGMTKDELDRSLDIMVSPKEGKKKSNFPPIGEIGIGMYSAGKICKNIILYSKKTGENSWHFQRIPIGQWMDDLINTKKTYLQEIIVSFKSEIPTSKETEIVQQGTKIILQGLYDNKFQEILDDKFLMKLCRIVPLSFGDDIDKLKMVTYLSEEDKEGLNIFKEEINSIYSGDKFGKISIENGVSIPLDYNFSDIFFAIKDGADRKTIQMRRPVPGDEIITPKNFFQIKKFCIDGVLVGFGWALFRGPTKKIAAPQFSDVNFRGIIVRLYNVLVYEPKDVWEWAKSDVLSLKSHPLDNIWGEILLYSPELHPKSNRNAIQETEFWKKLRGQISEWLREVADEGERQRKKSQKANRLYNLYLENFQNKIKTCELNLKDLKDFNKYEQKLVLFSKDPSNEENLSQLITQLCDLISNLENTWSHIKKNLDVSENEKLQNEAIVKDINDIMPNLQEIEDFLKELDDGIKVFDKDNLLKSQALKKSIRKFKERVSEMIGTIDALFSKEQEIKENIERKKRELEKQKKEELEKRIREVQWEKDRKVKEEREIIEKEKKQIEEERKKLEESKKKLEEESKRMGEERQKARIEKIKQKEPTLLDEKDQLEKPALINTLTTPDKFEEMQRARKDFKDKKNKLGLNDLTPIFPKSVTESEKLLLEFLCNFGNWILTNSTLDKNSILNGIQLTIKNLNS